MPRPNVKYILSTPLELVRPATDTEKSCFSDKKGGWLYTFGLKSGQRFVAHLSENSDVFTFRPVNNLLPELIQFVWQRKKNTKDLSYDTIYTMARMVSDDEKSVYEWVLSPRRRSDKDFHYPPMLERAICLRNELLAYEIAKKVVLDSEKRLSRLLVPNDEQCQCIRKKMKERRQKNG